MLYQRRQDVKQEESFRWIEKAARSKLSAKKGAHRSSPQGRFIRGISNVMLRTGLYGATHARRTAFLAA
jgi:hypothetical protein